MKNKNLVALVLLLAAAIFIVALPKNVQAAGGPVDPACIASAGTNPCISITPEVNVIPQSKVGGTIQLRVNFTNIPSFSGWDIAVKTNAAVLKPVSIQGYDPALGTVSVFTNCENGVGTGCGSDDGSGIAHSAATALGTSDAGNGVLFNITYTVVASGLTTVTFVNGVGPSIVSDPAGTTLVDCAATPNQCVPGTATIGTTIFDYTLTNNSPVTIQAGQTGQVTVTATLTASTSMPVTLACTGLPTGITCTTFNPNPVTPTSTGATSTLQVIVASTVAAGSYSFQVTGTPPGATASGASTTVHVTVTVPIVKDNTSTSVAPVTCTIPLGGSSCTASVVASVTDTTASTNSPTGTVTFTLTPGTTGGSLSSPTCTLSTTASVTSCSVTFTGTTPGSGTVTAMYGGDSTHNTSTSTATPVTVTGTGKDNTTTNIAPVACNIAVSATSCTANVIATVADTTTPTNIPTGTVSFTLTAGTTGGSLSSNSCTLSSGTCMVTFTGTTAGTGSITATYSGDTTHNTSTGTASVTVTKTSPGKDNTTTSVQNVSCNIAQGSNSCTASVTATVTDTTTATNSPTGTVTFTLTPGTTGGSLSANSCTLSTITGVTSCSVTFTGTTAGSGTITASYGGDTTHAGSTSTAASVTVTKTPPTKDNTSTSVAPVSCNIPSGSSSCSTTVTATVTDTTVASNSPSGTVTFTLTPGTTGGSLSGNTCTLATSSGVTSCSVTFTGTMAGTGSVTATYGGDATHITSTSGAATVTVTKTVAKDNTSTSITCSPSKINVTQTSNCTVTVSDTSNAENVPTGTVMFSSTKTAVGTVGSSCTLTGGSCHVTFTGVSAGTAMVNATYTGDTGHNASNGLSNTITVSSPGGRPVLLTFTGCDLDDFDNGTGQLNVLVNGHLVVNIPAGLNHLTGTGDYGPYANKCVKFGPFDISSFIVQGRNKIVFTSPEQSEHFGIVKNVTITQGSVVLLHVQRATPIFEDHSVTYTFSSSPLVLSSFTAQPSNAMVDQQVKLTATFSGGTGPFKCYFDFGDREHAVVTGVNGSCTVLHDYDHAGTFHATVTIIGGTTGDVAVGHVTVSVTGHGGDDNGPER